jgi:hypothetical protein
MFYYIQEEIWTRTGNSVATLPRPLTVSVDGIMFTNTFCNGRWNNTQTYHLLHLTRGRNNMERQLERLRAHITQQPDWRLAPENIFRDDGHDGAKLSRPGLDRLRDRVAMASFSLVLMTAPDRLARNYVHQVLNGHP